MFELFLVAYPWDLPAEDLDGALDRLRGEVGVTGLSLWVAAPAGAQFRAIAAKPRVFRTRGGLFFQPAERYYARTRCQPVMSGWVTTGHPLAPLTQACAKRGLSLRFIVSAAAAGRMAERYPEFACRNAFGDKSQTRLCLANPEVQSYLCAMVADLSSRDEVRGLTLADFDIRWSDAEVETIRTPAPFGPVETLLLATCFCESCHHLSEKAGIDVEAARHTVEAVLHKTVENGCREAATPGVFVAEHAALGEYRRRQTDELNSLLRKLKEACGCELSLERAADAPADGAAGALDLSIPDSVITLVGDADELPNVTCSRARRNEIQLPASSVVGAAGVRLVGILPEAAKAGFAAVGIDNYGILPEGALPALRQAIRFARRTAAE